jgi:hypothetical protein
MKTTGYHSLEGRLKAIRFHPLRWQVGYEDRGDWISLEESSYHVGPLEIVIYRDTFITSRHNWRRWTLWPSLRSKRKGCKQ